MAIRSLAAMIGKGLEGCGPSQPQVADINPVHGTAPLQPLPAPN
jgi:hypothetical protein